MASQKIEYESEQRGECAYLKVWKKNEETYYYNYNDLNS